MFSICRLFSLSCNNTLSNKFVQDWRRQLGIASSPQQAPTDEVCCDASPPQYTVESSSQSCLPYVQDSQKRATAAAAAAVSAHGSSGPATVTETRRFAGKDIQVRLCWHMPTFSLVSVSGVGRGGTLHQLSNHVYSCAMLRDLPTVAVQEGCN